MGSDVVIEVIYLVYLACLQEVNDSWLIKNKLKEKKN